MVDLASLQKKFPITEKTVKVESWDGEVKIKRLTLEQTKTVLKIQQEDGNVAGMIESVANCLIEPQLTVKDINDLNEEAFEGIREISKALNEFSEPKK